MARLTRAQLVDAYVDPQTVAKWMSALGARRRSSSTTRTAWPQRAGGDNSPCYEAFRTRAVLAPLWGVPGRSRVAQPRQSYRRRGRRGPLPGQCPAIGPSLVALQTALGRKLTTEELPHRHQGRRRGRRAVCPCPALAPHAGPPVHRHRHERGRGQRRLHRGLIWRLLGVLEQCRGKPAPRGVWRCPGGSRGGDQHRHLDRPLVDLFHTPGQEDRARELLMNNYTCSVESDLYCVNSTWIWKLTDDLPGLVRFDGIDRKLREVVTPAMLANDTELVAVSVDYNSETSSASRIEPHGHPSGGARPGRRADPGHHGLHRRAGPRRAGEVRSLLVGPARGDVPGWRSALGAAAVAGRPARRRACAGYLHRRYRSSDPVPESSNKNAVSILMRTIDLFVAQPRVGEVQQSEFMAVARRIAEYNVCRDRLVGVKGTEDFCRRSGAGFSFPWR